MIIRRTFNKTAGGDFRAGNRLFVCKNIRRFFQIPAGTTKIVLTLSDKKDKDGYQLKINSSFPVLIKVDGKYRKYVTTFEIRRILSDLLSKHNLTSVYLTCEYYN